MVCEADGSDFKTYFSAIDKLKGLNPASAIIVVATDLSSAEVSKLINELDVFAILKPKDNHVECIKKLSKTSKIKILILTI